MRFFKVIDALMRAGENVVTVNVVDTTAPTVTATLAPVGQVDKDKDENSD